MANYFERTPLSSFLTKEQAQEIESYYTDFEKVPVSDIYFSEPSMQGVMDINKANEEKTDLHVVILQETLLSKDREICWSRKFLNKCPASLTMPLALKLEKLVGELFENYEKVSREAVESAKKE